MGAMDHAVCQGLCPMVVRPPCQFVIVDDTCCTCGCQEPPFYLAYWMIQPSHSFSSGQLFTTKVPWEHKKEPFFDDACPLERKVDG